MKLNPIKAIRSIFSGVHGRGCLLPNSWLWSFRRWCNRWTCPHHHAKSVFRLCGTLRCDLQLSQFSPWKSWIVFRLRRDRTSWSRFSEKRVIDLELVQHLSTVKPCTLSSVVLSFVYNKPKWPMLPGQPK